MTTGNFDERASTWDDDPSHVERAEHVARAIREAVPLDRSTRLLEYGAGTGLLTQALRDSVGPVTLADTSSGMRKVMEDKIAAGAITDARVWDVDLAAAKVPDDRFDLIVTAMALHHIPALDAALSAFAQLLDGGGHLCIADLEHSDGSFHGEGFEGHDGFERAALTKALEAAGFTDVEFRPCHHVEKNGKTYPMFLATCSRR